MKLTTLTTAVERSDCCPLQKDFLPNYKRACDIRNGSNVGKLKQAVLLCLSFLFGTAVQHAWIKAKGCVCACNVYCFFFYAESQKGVPKLGKFCQILLILRNY